MAEQAPIFIGIRALELRQPTVPRMMAGRQQAARQCRRILFVLAATPMGTHGGPGIRCRTGVDLPQSRFSHTPGVAGARSNGAQGYRFTVEQGNTNYVYASHVAALPAHHTPSLDTHVHVVRRDGDLHTHVHLPWDCKNMPSTE